MITKYNTYINENISYDLDLYNVANYDVKRLNKNIKIYNCEVAYHVSYGVIDYNINWNNKKLIAIQFYKLFNKYYYRYEITRLKLNSYKIGESRINNFDELKESIIKILENMYNLDINNFEYIKYTNWNVDDIDKFKFEFYKMLFENDIILNVDNLNKYILDIYYYFNNKYDILSSFKYVQKYLYSYKLKEIEHLINAKNFDLI